MNIVIKLPNDLDQRVLSFPFLHTLHKLCSQKLEEDEVLKLHLIASKEHIDVLYLLPFTAFYHEIDPADLKTIFSIHRGVAELKIDNPDLFISATDSFVDATIGKHLAIPRRAGFAIGKNKMFLTDKIEKNAEPHFSDQLFPLIKAVEPFPMEMLNAYSRSLKPAYADWKENPYILIDLPVNKEGEIDKVWEEFFELVPRQHFILMSSELSEIEQEDQINEWIKNLPLKHTYKLYSYVSNIEFARVAAHSRGFITWNRGLSLTASYAGVNHILLGKKNTQEKFGPKYFRGEVEFVEMLDSSEDAYSKAFDALARLAGL